MSSRPCSTVEAKSRLPTCGGLSEALASRIHVIPFTLGSILAFILVVDIFDEANSAILVFVSNWSRGFPL